MPAKPTLPVFRCAAWLTALLIAGPVSAGDGGLGFGMQMGPEFGPYRFKQSAAITDGATGEPLTVESFWKMDASFETDSESFSKGVQLNPRVHYRRVSVEVATEIMQFEVDGEEIHRLEFSPTLGYAVGSHGLIRAGYRIAVRGYEILFSDDQLFSERGYVIGGGVEGVVLGPVSAGITLAYNGSRVDRFSVQDRDMKFGGISVKAEISPMKYPRHAFQIQYQQFKGSDVLHGDLNDDGVSDVAAFKLREKHLQLAYLYTLGR